jgi:hypothetical protein
MDHQASHHCSVGRAVLVAFVLVLLVLVAAAPVAAAPAGTAFRVTPQSAEVVWGTTLILNGVLQVDVAPPLPLDRQVVQVQRSSGPGGPWAAAGTITNEAGPYSSGAYAYSELATATWYWRMRFAGTGQWAAAVSNVVKVAVSPVLGKPACPKRAVVGSKVRVHGSLKPNFKAGSKSVEVKVQRYSGGRWKAYMTRAARTSDSGSYSEYSVKIAFSARGKYRFRAVKPADGAFAEGKSAFSRSLRVQ